MYYLLLALYCIIYYWLCIVLLALYCIICYWLYIVLFVIGFVLYYLLLALYCIIYYWLYIVLFVIGFVLYYLLLALYCIIYYWLYIVLFVIGFILYCLLLALYCIIYYWLYIVSFIVYYYLLLSSHPFRYCSVKSVEFWSRLSCFLNPKATFSCHITDANYLQDFEVKVSLKGSDCCLCAKYRDKYDIIPLSQITLLCDQPILGDEVKVYRPEHARFRADAISFAEIKIITT